MPSAVVPSGNVQTTTVGFTSQQNPVVFFSLDGVIYSSSVEYFSAGGSRRFLYPTVNNGVVTLVAFDLVFGTAIPQQNPVVQIFVAS